jgi:hypothetical protein
MEDPGRQIRLASNGNGIEAPIQFHCTMEFLEEDVSALRRGIQTHSYVKTTFNRCAILIDHIALLGKVIG